MVILVITMLFNGGLIPNFYLVRALGLLDTLWALILTQALSAFNVILMKNFFAAIPQSLDDSARIDGASYPMILVRVVLPLSKAVLATIGLFLAVMYWNGLLGSMVYIESREKWPIQLFLREIIASARALENMTQGNLAEAASRQVAPVTLQYAVLMISIVPILFVYPFLQKHFSKGVLLGAIKG
jgi:putative aldouronate transport system permease protein